MAARASRPKKAARWAVRPRAVLWDQELPDLVVLEVGVDEISQGRPLRTKRARWRCRAGSAGGGGRAGFVRDHGRGSSSLWWPRAGGVRPHSLWGARQASGMCDGDGMVMWGAPRVAAECTCTERAFGRCARPTVRPGRTVHDNRDHGDGSPTLVRAAGGRAARCRRCAIVAPASLASCRGGKAMTRRGHEAGSHRGKRPNCTGSMSH